MNLLIHRTIDRSLHGRSRMSPDALALLMGFLESTAVDAVIYGIRKRFGNVVERNVRGLGWTVPGSVV